MNSANCLNFNLTADRQKNCGKWKKNSVNSEAKDIRESFVMLDLILDLIFFRQCF